MKRHNLREKVIYTINQYDLLKAEDGIVIGVSGGVDSMALLHLLVSLREEWKLKLQVVHVNHGLRGVEADQEAEFVVRMADLWGVAAKIYSFNVASVAEQRGCSLQEAGRSVRYQAFDETAQALDYQRIAVAHNASDQTETVLENLLRGSGLNGLGGMYYRRGRIIRPLLGLTRSEIELYLEENKIRFCLDPSNKKTIYLRNRIRLELIPYLVEEYNPNLSQGLNQMAEIFRDENDLLVTLAQEAGQRCLNQPLEAGKPKALLNIPKLLSEPVALQRRVIREILGVITGEVREFTFKHVEGLLELSRNPVGGRRVYLPGNLQGRREANQLILEPRLVRRRIK